MMITLAVDNGRQGKVDQLGLECVVGVTLTKDLIDLYFISSSILFENGKT
ncbi:TPA: hypothetical protein NEV73_000794 [Acinetobacter baumannii]|nr:hypothetical protein [Acinetobacter baumannii]HCD9554528.1 hypothetical protein [Acinetobacter baumannii]HCD9557815.1 hypothetical protein [Acinetobacter baumannii]HCD9982139.1 hypothetical protein [Acinetobacter baumannii]HCE0020291.1 hypothetical protein [Acinetobacter baumannii]